MKGITIFFILFFIFVSIFIIVYFFIEKPAQEQSAEYNNLTIRTTSNGEQIISNYSIYFGNVLIKEGKTLSNNWIREMILYNNSFSIYFESSNTYSKYVNYQVNELNRYIRIDEALTSVGNLTVTQNGTLGIDNPINLTLTLNPNIGEVRDLSVCLFWSENILSLYINNYSMDVIPRRLSSKVIKCYSTYITLNQTNSNITIPIYYKKWHNLNEKDFINIYIVDRDINLDSLFTNINEFRGSDFRKNDIFLYVK